MKHTSTALALPAATGLLLALTFALPVFATSSATGTPAAAGSAVETRINSDGTANVQGAKITAISSSTISAAQTWGSLNISWTIRVASTTELLRKHGGASSLSEFSVGDIIAFSGPVDTTQSSLTVNATQVKNYSIQKVSEKLTGTVQSVNASTSSFVLTGTSRGTVTVQTASSTEITRNGSTVAFSEIAPGQKVDATGILNTLTSTLAAEKVKIHVDSALLKKRLFEGRLVGIASTTTPTTLTFIEGNRTFTVNVGTNTVLLSKRWNLIPLSRMSVGDKIRIYGAVQSANMSTIDAWVVRDTSVR